MRARELSRLGDENGAVAVIAALLLTVLLLFAALALDLGALRADRASGQLVADMAATAGAYVHDAAQPGSARSACEQAVAYASENLDVDLVVDPDDGPGGCEQFLEADVCAPDDEPITARYWSGDLFVDIINPVPDPLDDDPTGLMQDVSYASDGTPCDRIGVRIRRDRDFLLAPVGSSDQVFQSGSTTRSAVAASLISGEPADFASLIILQREGCQTLEGGGGGVLQVLNDGETPGTIVVDTLPTTGPGVTHCQTNPSGRKVIDAKTSTGSLIRAEGGIKVYAGRSDSEWTGVGLSDPENTYTWPPNAVTGGQLDPRPTPGRPITRALVDYRYNCLVDGYTSGQPWSPSFGNQPIDACPESTFEIVENDAGQRTQVEIPAPPPYLKRLEETVVDVMAAPGGAEGWQILDCNDTSSVKNGGNWVVPCPDTFGPEGLTFQGAGHIIFENGLSLGTGDEINIYGADENGDGPGTTVTMYSGGLETSGGVLEFRGVFTYIRSTSTSTDGRISVSGSTNRFALQAPLDDSECGFQYDASGNLPAGPPEAACFSPLAVWSNYVGSGDGNRQNRIAGNAAGGLVGTLFTPSSRFIFQGSGDPAPACGAPTWNQIANTTSTLALQGAQFFASRVRITSDAEIGMCPSPSTTLPTDPQRVVSLLR